VIFIANVSREDIESLIFAEIVAVETTFPDACTRCMAWTELLHITALTQPPETITNLLILVCKAFDLPLIASSCNEEFSGAGGLGPYLAQLFAKMSQTTGDMQAWCYYQFNVCTSPPVIQINESDWFSPKPEGVSAPEPSGETINVLHLSDWHLDPRYDIGSEANCTEALCCRPYSTNTALTTDYTNASVPASRFGYLLCDSPADLAISVFSEMPNFVDMSDITFSIFTGDIVSHDPIDQLSRAYVEYEEAVTYQTFQAWLGNIVNHCVSSADLAFICHTWQP
jgi:sphingomyelin phosphodiesterase